MAAAIKALNARIRANPVSDYFCSTHFWGPASNFGIPIAAVMDTQKDPEIISGPMTAALLGYSATFMRYAMAVSPRNYLLFGCHIVNFSAQTTQAYRYMNYHYMGGNQAALQARAKEGLAQAEGSLEGAASSAERMAREAKAKVEGGARDLAAQAKVQADKVMR
ncbi:hypothetical protein LTR91_025456 [Friedmanniomyces endolithicus]|uniref:Mitochondrial pyruvate carrier n=1 Tax=Friedmanniomyces endolithicus TaxID=329885 RepID=A0AAN6GYR0_9PEZI|nr:hypothetical protein LTR94_003670 [Friedmanniomyces endolithicus]KAK0812207.1 hypothetical protein LTR59_001683 [Friedmanniomyces endolithicus]KAK0819213.1 hypothetical protein LTR38_000656 [Friedmanniomyces endolithicus]KAK0821734.1 hypothetical protein LTR75_000391 [Friedmanniomyces endolithicus]KAK0848100.1 hypothetical protein LTR03_005999 [Friedmanniomyces endolithicus]